MKKRREEWWECPNRVLRSRDSISDDRPAAEPSRPYLFLRKHHATRRKSKASPTISVRRRIAGLTRAMPGNANAASTHPPPQGGFDRKIGGGNAALCDDSYRWQHGRAARMMETPYHSSFGRVVFVFVGFDAVVFTWNTR